jgi:hypothetical protein
MLRTQETESGNSVAGLFVRPSIEELKSEWCHGELRIVASDSDVEIYAMPFEETRKSRIYIDHLLEIKTYFEAQELYEKYVNDPEAPRLTPALFSLNSDIERMDQRVQQEFLDKGIWDSVRWESSLEEVLSGPGFSDLNLAFECSTSSLWSEVKNLSFNLESDPCYNADENARFLTQAPLWTDAWIPLEIANEIGEPDKELGLDYEPAEFVYLDIDKFIHSFSKHGFEVIVDNKEIDYLGWEWTWKIQ